MAKELMAKQPLSELGFTEEDPKSETNANRAQKEEERKDQQKKKKTKGTGSWPGRDARGNSKRSSRRRRVAGAAKDGTKEGLETTFETFARDASGERLFFLRFTLAL
jgi:hypothetical protein